MMLLKRRFIIMLLLCLTLLLLIIEVNSSSSNSNDKDPFRSLGIPDLNPKALLSEIDYESNKSDPNKGNGKVAPLKTIDDLPNFLKNSNLNEEDGIKTLTRFLIQDDFTLKKYGVVYDQSGFDGLVSGERIAPIGTEERLQQRARSTANIWFKEKFPKLEYDAYGAENLMDEIVPNWRSYKVLMIGKHGENTFLKVCLPLDESETALCSDKDELCGPRANYVEKEKKKNEEYIQKIRTNNFFKKKPGSGNIKLLPGEKLVAKQGDRKVVIDSSSQNAKSDGFFNPPSVESANGNDPLLNAFRMKNNNMPGYPNNLSGMAMNNLNMGMNLPQNFAATPTNPILPNVNGFNPNFNLRGAASSPAGLNLPNQGSPAQGYNFKQRDPIAQIPAGPQPTNMPPGSPGNIDNNQLMNELMNMKNQLSQMMASLKQKDEIINQQNMKLSQFGNGMNMMPPMNGIGNPMINGMNPMGSMNGMNSMGYGPQAQMPNSPGFLSQNMMGNGGMPNINNINNLNPNFLGGNK